MNKINRFKLISSLCAIGIMSGILLLPARGVAQVTLSDGGSVATVNVGNSGVLGMNSWTVGGIAQSQLNQQWFWYSLGDTAPQPINSIGTASVTYNAPNDVTVTYANSTITATIEYTLSGNGPTSGSADMSENISVVNNAANSVNLSFYQYSNFNLLQNNNNTVSISGGPGAFTGAMQTAGGPGSTGIGEVIVAPDANHAEAAQVPQTLNELGGSSYLTLNDSTSATGDVSWAFQWDATLAANGGEFDLSKDKGLSVTIVPEPSSMALIAPGLAALGFVRRRQAA